MNPIPETSQETKNTIIVVDDDESIRDMLRITLESEGFQVICAPNSKDIVLLARTHQPALIIMDLIMPEHEGMEGIFALVASSRVPILAISSNVNFLHLIEKVVAMTLSKPFSSETILYSVHQMLKKAAPPAN